MKMYTVYIVDIISDPKKILFLFIVECTLFY